MIYQVKVSGKNSLGQEIWVVFLTDAYSRKDAVTVIQNEFDFSDIDEIDFDVREWDMGTFQIAGNRAVMRKSFG